MQLVGHGIDIVEIEEFIGLANDPGWLERCFSAEEVAQFPEGPTRVAHIAGRFAAKEAVLKALGTGQGDGIAFSDVIVARLDGSPPSARLVGGAGEVAADLRISSWMLSISHSPRTAVASAIATSEDQAR